MYLVHLALYRYSGSKINGGSNDQRDSKPVDYYEISEDQAGSMLRTITGPRQQIQEQHEERQPQHLSRITLSTYALSKKEINDVRKDIEEAIKIYETRRDVVIAFVLVILIAIVAVIVFR